MRRNFSAEENDLPRVLYSKTSFLYDQVMAAVERPLPQKRRTGIMKILDALTSTLVIVGALNWGLVAAADFDLVATLFGMRFGETSAASSAVYALVGLSAVYQVLTWRVVKRQGSIAGARA
jgi:uncharacterized membrane protein YuzA (DUF378 family)